MGQFHDFRDSTPQTVDMIKWMVAMQVTVTHPDWRCFISIEDDFSRSPIGLVMNSCSVASIYQVGA